MNATPRNAERDTAFHPVGAYPAKTRLFNHADHPPACAATAPLCRRRAGTPNLGCISYSVITEMLGATVGAFCAKARSLRSRASGCTCALEDSTWMLRRRMSIRSGNLPPWRHAARDVPETRSLHTIPPPPYSRY